MLILAVDTSSPAGSLAALHDDALLASVFTRTDAIHSSRTFRHLDFLLSELSLRLDQIDLFAVTAGPGSFTGLRVGLAAVKGWAEVYQKPVVAVSALEAVAVQSHSPGQLVIPVLDARRSQIYFGIYRRAEGLDGDHLALEGQESVASPDEFLAALRERATGSQFTVVTPKPEMLSAALGRLKTLATAGRSPLEPVSEVLAPHVGRVGYLHARRGELSDALTLDANYIRRSDAELHWKGSPGS